LTPSRHALTIAAGFEERSVQFGMQFFPDVTPAKRSAQQYFADALNLVGLCDVYGYSHVRTVEHYFHHWGGYSPSPIVFLTAASQRTKTARMVTGAVLPVFNHPLKLAGELAMLDAISGGRLEIGFARAFLPFEYRHFGVSMDESVARFEEGIEQVRLLLENEVASSRGRFHSFDNVTSLPRPTQKPRPPFYLAAVGTPDSFERAGRLGYGLMAIPGVGHNPTELIQIYRNAWRKAGHPGRGTIMMAVFMYCHERQDEAERIARGPIERHFASIYDAMSEHARMVQSADYKGYDKMVEKVRQETFETQVAHHAAFVGTPDRIVEKLREYDAEVGGCDHVSMQVNFNDMSYADAERSVRLFGEAVIPQFAPAPARAAG
jgi:alkanesulfonate monooxygenase SsuD/methylene tetrahydromethanopterin reductase-like flavin-dependent oxidoreductase (luciferase family)